MIEYAPIGLVVLIHLIILVVGIPAKDNMHKARISETPDKDPREDNE